MLQVLITILFLLITVILLPWLAFLSAKQPPIRQDQQTAAFIQSIVLQIILAAIGLVTWKSNGLNLIWVTNLGAITVSVIVAIVTFAFLLQWLNFKFLQRSHTSDVFNTPTFRQKFLKQLVFGSAAISEEIVYRGVLFALIFSYSGSELAAYGLVATLFALSHLKQGIKGFVFSFLISLLLQVCMMQTGVLMTAITHYLINLAPEILLRLSRQNK